MKIFLTVFAALVLLVILILTRHLKLRVTSNGKLKLKVGIGPVMVRVFPKKEKQKRAAGLSQKKYLRLVEECRRAAEVESKAARETSEFGELEDIGETVAFAKRVLTAVAGCTARSKCSLHTCRVMVGGDNAARIAVTSAAINRMLHSFAHFALSSMSFTYNESTFGAECDFTSDRITIDFDMTVRLRVIDCLRELIKAFAPGQKAAQSKSSKR